MGEHTKSQKALRVLFCLRALVPVAAGARVRCGRELFEPMWAQSTGHFPLARVQPLSTGHFALARVQALGFAMKSARFAASASGSYDDAVPWYERLCVDCPLSGESGHHPQKGCTHVHVHTHTNVPAVR